MVYVGKAPKGLPVPDTFNDEAKNLIVEYSQKYSNIIEKLPGGKYFDQHEKIVAIALKEQRLLPKFYQDKLGDFVKKGSNDFIAALAEIELLPVTILSNSEYFDSNPDYKEFIIEALTPHPDMDTLGESSNLLDQ